MDPVIQEVELAWRSAGSLLNVRAERSGSNPRKARAQRSVSRCPPLRTKAHFRHRRFLPSNARLGEIGTHPARMSPNGAVLRLRLPRTSTCSRNIIADPLSAGREFMRRQVLPRLTEPIREALQFDASLLDLIEPSATRPKKVMSPSGLTALMDRASAPARGGRCAAIGRWSS
jgi:hypothetical protein